jgi:transcriptional regulator with XRE-family HTH domain
MIFADKLIQLRKKSGWSQEDLAEQMNVTRQSVSKWESAQSIPDLDKLVRLSEIFGVSLDYLLKDEMEEAENLNISEDVPQVKRVSMEEANKFLAVKESTAGTIANAVFLCIISPICLFILGAVSENAKLGLPENVAGGIGMVVLLAIVASAVSIFISNGSKTEPFSYLDTEVFETEYGVSGMVKERKERYKDTYTKNNIIGTSLCILSLVPLFATAAFDEGNDFLLVIMLSVGFLVVGIGVNFFVRAGIIWGSYEKLLQEGDYTKPKKKAQPVISVTATAYWTVVTAIFLGYSLATHNWGYSWIVWVVAGVLYPAVLAVVKALTMKKK